ncbi:MULTISPECIES: hypothetical protein [Limnobaculum]|uniref:hypothetical protein n=1 Tax=Limnobaculum TaxID=2172100 RepID=UPI002AA5798D|nr:MULTISPECIES: hypothetical protein [Limnobaculum]
MTKLHELKNARREGRCPSTERKAEKQQRLDENKISQEPIFTVKDLIELYLTQRIEDRKSNDGKIIPSARKRKGQSEVRRTLQNDAGEKLRHRVASQITRKDVVDLVMGVIERGANVQAGNLLKEFSSAYEFAIGLGYFDDSFANPALLAKSSLSQTKN